MKAKIENIDNLRSEILRLKLQRYQQEAIIQHDVHEITEKFKAPLKFFSRMGNVFGDHNKAASVNHDWVTNILRVGLPVMLNKFMFKGSGFFMKTLVTLASQKAATTVNKDLLTGLAGKVSSWFKSKNGKQKPAIRRDYGIPPDSETF